MVASEFANVPVSVWRIAIRPARKTADIFSGKGALLSALTEKNELIRVN